MFGCVRCDVYSLRECKVIVNLLPAEVAVVKFEPLEVEDQIVGHILQAGPRWCQPPLATYNVSTYRLTASTSLPPHDSHLYLLSPSMASPWT
jgi:hypothetical protein